MEPMATSLIDTMRMDRTAFVIECDDLLANKRASRRPKDLADVDALTR